MNVSSSRVNLINRRHGCFFVFFSLLRGKVHELNVYYGKNNEKDLKKALQIEKDVVLYRQGTRTITIIDLASASLHPHPYMLQY